MKEKVEANSEMGLLSKRLATIIVDAPVDFEPENFKVKSPNQKKVTDIFNELEFRRMAENFAKTFSPLSEKEPKSGKIDINQNNNKNPCLWLTCY